MLSGKIMHQCIKKLISDKDEESLESLCRLFTTIGKDLELETKGKFDIASDIAEVKSQVCCFVDLNLEHLKFCLCNVNEM